MIALVNKTELEKQFGEVTHVEWCFAIEEYGKRLNNLGYSPSKEEQLDEISTIIDEFRRV